MKSTTKFFSIVIVLMILGIFINKLVKKESVSTPIDTTPVSTQKSLTYYCTEGAIAVVYSDTQATLTLPDKSVFTLPQSRSASGVRYESDNVTFITKGNYGFLQKDGTTVYSNCIVGTEVSVHTSITKFTDGSQMFSFEHPNNLSVTGGDASYAMDWRTNTQTLGLSLAKVRIPQSQQPNTNFSEAIFTVGTSSDPEEVKNCLTPTNGERAKGTTTIHDVVYQKITLTDAGAGNYYDTTSYRTLQSDQCYAIEYTIHSTNIGNYSPDQHIREFDTKAITAELESMTQSFAFISN